MLLYFPRPYPFCCCCCCHGEIDFAGVFADLGSVPQSRRAVDLGGKPQYRPPARDGGQLRGETSKPIVLFIVNITTLGQYIYILYMYIFIYYIKHPRLESDVL